MAEEARGHTAYTVVWRGPALDGAPRPARLPLEAGKTGKEGVRREKWHL